MDVMNEILRLKATTRSFGQGIEEKKKKKRWARNRDCNLLKFGQIIQITTPKKKNIYIYI